MNTLTRREFGKRSLRYALVGAAGYVSATGCGSAGHTVSPSAPPNGNSATVSYTDRSKMAAIAADFMGENAIPALSIAISLNDRLMYAEAFGVSDLSTAQPAVADNLFRVASISKTVTATALFQLVDQGRLDLSATVFGDDGILGNRYAPYLDDNVTKITVAQLLTHTSGGWPNKPGADDEIFLNLSLDTYGLIANCVQKVKLTYAPGTTYAYSNIGFVILGRVIEALTSMSYAAAANVLVLQPCGIMGMQMGGSTLAERLPMEVVYYGSYPDDRSPYNLSLSRGDSADGWLATASDLVRFLNRVDNIAVVPDILPQATVVEMTTPVVDTPIGNALSNKSAAATDGFGWELPAPNEWGHFGALDGTTATFLRSNNGFAWAALTNTHSDQWSEADLNSLVLKMVQSVTDWPS